MTDGRKARFRIAELATLLTIFGLLAALVFPAIQALRSAARRTQRMNQLKYVGIAVQNVHDTYRQLLAAVRRDEQERPLASWRYHIIPFIAAFMVDVDYSKPWYDPDAKYFSTRPMEPYCFPEALRDAPRNTNVTAIVGPGTIWDETRVNRSSEFTGETILAMEVVGLDCHWMEPGDVHVHRLPESLMDGVDGFGVVTVCMDGSIAFFDKATPVAHLRRRMTNRGVRTQEPNVPGE